MPILKTIQHIKCNTAEDFINSLRVTAPHWGGRHKQKWCFRGQKNAKHHLIPSAWRKGAKLSYENPPIRGPMDDFVEQCYNEARMVFSFLDEADEVGLKIPGDTHVFRTPEGWLDKVFPSIKRGEWPPAFALETTAIAQHHGVPTRLLDFSYSPYVAAFFAASGARDWEREKFKKYRPLKTDRFAVWAVALDCFQAYWSDRSPRLQTVTVPRAANEFLHRQHGLFILDRSDRFYWGKPQYGWTNSEHPVPLDVILSFLEEKKKAGYTKGEKPDPPYIMRITAPINQASKVLTVLSEEGWDIKQLMPTYDNVVRCLERKRDGWTT